MRLPAGDHARALQSVATSKFALQGSSVKSQPQGSYPVQQSGVGRNNPAAVMELMKVSPLPSEEGTT